MTDSDIPFLVRRFADHFARRMNKAVRTIPNEAMRALPSAIGGNIRELQKMQSSAR